MRIVLIPSIGCSDRFEGVVEAAKASKAEAVWVVENQKPSGDRHSPSAYDRITTEFKDSSYVNYKSIPGFSLYQVWNWGLAQSMMNPDPSVCVILNDDVEITAGAIDLVLDELDKHPEFAVMGFNYRTRFLDPVADSKLLSVTGTYRHGGIGGFAFAARGDVCIVDEDFEWWGGDDDLVFSALAKGYLIGLLEGAPVRHPEPETSAIHFPDLLAAKDRDRARMRAKWDESW